jgi:chorismate synthase
LIARWYRRRIAPAQCEDHLGSDSELRSEGSGAFICCSRTADPCIGIRAVPVGKAMMACVLADQALRHRAQVG